LEKGTLLLVVSERSPMLALLAWNDEMWQEADNGIILAMDQSGGADRGGFIGVGA
jgi:hypothetical protein